MRACDTSLIIRQNWRYFRWFNLLSKILLRFEPAQEILAAKEEFGRSQTFRPEDNFIALTYENQPDFDKES
jgi:hypothetical protein